MILLIRSIRFYFHAHVRCADCARSWQGLHPIAWLDGGTEARILVIGRVFVSYSRSNLEWQADSREWVKR